MMTRHSLADPCALSEMFSDRAALSRDCRRKALKLELEVRNALHRLSALITTMHSEFSLLPVCVLLLLVYHGV